MGKLKSSYQGRTEGCARALGRDISISPKWAIEITKFLLGRDLDWAIDRMEKVIAKKEAIPITRFTNGAGHKSGLGPAKYPVKASREILALLRQVKANALEQAIGEHLKIVHFAANKASSPWHYGRQRRRQMKRAHVEVVVGAYVPAKTKRIGSKSKKKTGNKKELSSAEQKSKEEKQKPEEKNGN